MNEKRNASKDIEERYKEVCKDSAIAHRAWDVAYAQSLSERDSHRMIIVAALEALDATQKALEQAIMEAPPDAFWVRDENGERCIMRYVGPTLDEIRRSSAAEAELGRISLLIQTCGSIEELREKVFRTGKAQPQPGAGA